VNEVLLPGRQCGSIWSADLVQVKGWQRSFHPSMKASMAAIRSLTEVKLPRRMACRVMIEKKTSTRFSHDPDVGVKCRMILGCSASQARTPARAAIGLDQSRRKCQIGSRAVGSGA
jgi:hypothetical protein